MEFQIFFEANVLFMDFSRCLGAHVTIMPRLVDYAGDICFIFGITVDESIFITIFMEPFINIVSRGTDTVGVNIDTES